ncbi:hypothetical protein AAMO2058_001407800 [Amorphochlora amoebiformis]
MAAFERPGSSPTLPFCSPRMKKPSPLSIPNHEIKAISLGGFQYSIETGESYQISELFSEVEADVLKVAGKEASSTRTTSELLKAVSSQNQEGRAKAWLALLGNALGFHSDSKNQVKPAEEFCKSLLPHLSELSSGLYQAYEVFIKRRDWEHLKGLRYGLSLFCVILALLGKTRSPELISALIKAKVEIMNKEEDDADEKTRGSPAVGTTDKNESGAEEGMNGSHMEKTLLGLIVRMLGTKGPNGERDGVFLLPVKKLLFIFQKILSIFTRPFPDSKLEEKEKKTKESGRSIRCSEWDLRNVARKFSKKFSPVIVQSLDGELELTTFKTLPPAAKEALDIMVRNVKDNHNRRPANEIVDLFCKESLHDLEACIDGIVTAYLGVFSDEKSPGKFFPLDPKAPSLLQRHKIIVSEQATLCLINLISFLRRAKQRHISGYIIALIQRRNVLLICVRLLNSIFDPKTLTDPPLAANPSQDLSNSLQSWSGDTKKTEGSVWVKGVVATIKVLKLMQKLTKRSVLHARTLVKLKGLDILLKLEAVEEKTVSHYALKLLKSCYRHADDPWRKRQTRLLTSIYQNLRMDLIDPWCIPLEFESKKRIEMRKKEDEWRIRELYHLEFRRTEEEKRVLAQFPKPKQVKKEKKLDAEEYIKRLFEEVKLPEDFDQRCDDWVRTYLANQ